MLCACRRWTGLRPDKPGTGLPQFLLRHLEKVNGEWSLICTVRDLLKLFRFVRPVVNSFQSAIQMP